MKKKLVLSVIVDFLILIGVTLAFLGGLFEVGVRPPVTLETDPKVTESKTTMDVPNSKEISIVIPYIEFNGTVTNYTTQGSIGALELQVKGSKTIKKFELNLDTKIFDSNITAIVPITKLKVGDSVKIYSSGENQFDLKIDTMILGQGYEMIRFGSIDVGKRIITSQFKDVKLYYTEEIKLKNSFTGDEYTKEIAEGDFVFYKVKSSREATALEKAATTVKKATTIQTGKVEPVTISTDYNVTSIYVYTAIMSGDVVEETN